MPFFYSKSEAKENIMSEYESESELERDESLPLQM